MPERTPLWPPINPEDEPTLEEATVHNLACIATALQTIGEGLDALETIAERLDGVCAIGERISQHLFDLKRSR